MENFENGGFDHAEAEDRRDYGESQVKADEGSRNSYGDSSERPHRNYGDQHHEGGYRRGYSNNYGDRPRNNYGSYGNQQRRSFHSQDSSDEGYNRPRSGGYQQRGGYNQQRSGGYRPYNQNGDGEGYSHQRSGGYRSYNQNGDGEGYNRQQHGGYRQHRSYNQDGDESYNRQRSYGNQGGEDGYNRQRPYQQGGYRQHRSYNQDGDEGYNRPRRNNYGGSQYHGGQNRQRYANDGGYENNRYSVGYAPDEGRPVRGTKLRPRKNKPQPKPVETGIDRMIKRNPQLNDIMYSDNDLVNIPVKEVVRLNKFIANSGICSRREADNFITAGVVTVNGEVVTELGSKVNVNTDDVRFNGERLRGEAKVYIIMNKPKGFVTTASDPHAEKTVMNLLNGCSARVFPVGRLDKNTTGVLMFTNDGEIAEKLTHPSYDKKKIYQVTLTAPLTQEDYDKVLAGVTLTDGDIAADALEYVDDEDHRKIGIEIHSGKNRIVRRIFESLGYEVKGLDRVYFAGLTKKGIKRGGWRYLTEGEVNVLKMGAYN